MCSETVPDISLKVQKSCPLKAQPSRIAFHEHTVVLTAHGELHAVAALNLEGDIVGSARRAMEPVSAGGIARHRMAVMSCILALSYDLGWYSQSR